MLAGHLKAHGKNARHINAHGPRRIADQLGIGGENACHRARQQKHERPKNCGISGAQGQFKTERLLDPVFVACAVVKADHRLTALTNALQRHQCKLRCTGDHRHSTHRQIAAVTRQTGIKADGKQAFGGKHDERRNSQCDHRADHRHIRADQLFSQTQNGFFAGKKAQDPNSANGLTEHRGNGCTAHTKAEHKYENGVQHNVDHRADHGGEHTDLGKALRGDEGIHAQNHQHEHRAQDINAAIVQRIRQRDVAGAEPAQKGGRCGIEKHREHHGKDQQHTKAGIHNLFGSFLFPLPQRNGRAGRTACADDHGKRIEQHENGCKQAHARKRRRTDARNVADIDSIYNVVKQIDHLRHHGRDHKLQQQFRHAACAHLLFFGIQMYSSFLSYQVGCLWFLWLCQAQLLQRFFQLAAGIKRIQHLDQSLFGKSGRQIQRL